MGGIGAVLYTSCQLKKLFAELKCTISIEINFAGGMFYVHTFYPLINKLVDIS